MVMEFNRGDGDEDGSVVVVSITVQITGIIVNDYRNNHRRCYRRRRARPQSKRSGRPLNLADDEERGPNPKGVAGLQEDDGVEILWRILMVVVVWRR